MKKKKTSTVTLITPLLEIKLLLKVPAELPLFYQWRKTYIFAMKFLYIEECMR